MFLLISEREGEREKNIHVREKRQLAASSARPLLGIKPEAWDMP